MASEQKCPACGADLPRDAPQGFCPRCLAQLGHDLLPAAARAPVELPTPGSGSADPSPSANSKPQASPGIHQFGDYELLEEIARGGMGIVYRARQISLDRIVAVKLLLFGPRASKDFVQRFRTEATAAGSLQHPNIVAIHEVGIHQGEHYLVMGFLAGRSLADIVRDGPLPARRAAGYAKAIAEAIHYAHERGILHRDLKPSNVMIEADDQPKVTDFGLAKHLEKESELTLSGQVLGSPNYMPPEQAAAHRGLVGKRSDVYSVGAILYHSLTGRPPFVGQTVAETLHAVLHNEPLPPRVLTPSVPRDLETICLKCLEKEPARRYQTAQQLADELGRLLRHEPVQARPVSGLEKAWRWCLRNPVIAALSAIAALIFLLGFVGVTWQGNRAKDAAAEAKVQRDLAQGRLYAAQMKLAHAEIQAGKIGGALKLLEAQRPVAGEPDFRGFEWRLLYRLGQSRQSEVLATNASGFSAVDYSPDRRTVAFGSSEGAVEIFDIHTRQSVKRWRAHDGVINDMAFCPENARWLATTSGDDGVLKIWDITTERVLLSTNSSKGLWANLAFSLSGRLLVSGAPGATLNVWELRSMATEASLELLLKTNLAFLGPAAFAPDERTLAVCNRSVGHSAFDVGEYDLATGRVITFPKAHENLIECIAFSPDGSRLATGGADEHVVLWDPRKRVPIQTNATALINVMGLNFQDSQTLFASGWDQNIRCWDFQNPTEPLLLKGHAAGVNATAIALDGGTLASGGRDGTARLWNLRKEEMRSLAQPAEEFSTLLRSEDTASYEHGHLPVITSAVSPDQATVAAVTLENLIVCDVITGNRLATASATNIFRAQPTRLFGVAFSPDSRKLAVGSEDGSVVLLDATTLRSLNEPIQLHGNQITHIAFCLNGTVLATGGGFGTGVKLTELASGRVITNFSGVEGAYPIQAIAVSPDGKLLAMGSPEQVVYVRDIATGRILATSPQKVRLLHHVVFSPDGRLLAFSDEFGVIFLWDLSGQRSLANLIGHAGPVNALAFSPDGRTLASASMDHTIKLWHPEIDQEVATLTGHTAWVWSVLFAQQGDTLVSTSQDGTLKVWRALSFARLEAKAKIGNPLQ